MLEQGQNWILETGIFECAKKPSSEELGFFREVCVKRNCIGVFSGCLIDLCILFEINNSAGLVRCGVNLKRRDEDNAQCHDERSKD